MHSSFSSLTARPADTPTSNISNQSKTTRGANPFLRSWRWWLPVSALAFILAVLFVDPFAGDWDALDYIVLALEPRPSSMLLGRMLFIFTNNALWRVAHGVFGMDAASAYLLFKYFVVLQSPICVALVWLLAYDLTRARRTATVAALLVALSPFYIVYSGQAMTEIPSLLALAAGLVIYNRGIKFNRISYVLLGTLILGASVNIRELAALYAPWLIIAPLVYGWKLTGRNTAIVLAACVVFCVAAFAPFATWYLLDLQGYRAWWHGWVASTQAETARHPVTLANFRFLLLYFFIAAPVALPLLPFAIVSAWRRCKRGGDEKPKRECRLSEIHHGGTEDTEDTEDTEGAQRKANLKTEISNSRFEILTSPFALRVSPLLALGLLGVAANLSLIIHYSVVLNGRYMLTGLPAFAPLVADLLVRRRPRFARNARQAFAFVVLLVVTCHIVVGGIVLTQARRTLANHAHTGAYIARLRQLPEDGVIIAGAASVSVNYWRGIGEGKWETIGTGGGYYGEAWLGETIGGYLRQNRRVFLDADRTLWSRRGWQLEETRAISRLPARFRFRRISDTLYELRPLTDTTAADDPQLTRILVKNDDDD